jgi:hypothetical protein
LPRPGRVPPAPAVVGDSATLTRSAPSSGAEPAVRGHAPVVTADRETLQA